MTQAFQIAHMIDTLSWGGAQKLLVTFTEEARRYSIVPTIISLRSEDDSPFTQQLKALGARVLVFPCRRIIEPAQLVALTKLLQRERFDILHTHLTQANTIGGFLGRATRTSVVASIHNTEARRRRFHGLRQNLEYIALRFGAKRVIAVGATVAEAHGKHLRSTQMVTIPNAVSLVQPISPSERTTIRIDLMGDPNRPLLISVGRLTAQKGYTDLLTAIDRVRVRYPLVMLVIAGRGDLHGSLQAQIERLQLENNVRLLGARTDIPQLLAASDIFVSSSHWEGLPIAVLEAMSARLPIVATSVGDIRNVVTTESGSVVPPQRPDLLVSAIESFLGSPTVMQRAGMAAYEQVIQYYSPNIWVNRLLELYAEVCRHSDLLQGTLQLHR